MHITLLNFRRYEDTSIFFWTLLCWWITFFLIIALIAKLRNVLEVEFRLGSSAIWIYIGDQLCGVFCGQRCQTCTWVESERIWNCVYVYYNIMSVQFWFSFLQFFLLLLLTQVTLNGDFLYPSLKTLLLRQ